MSSVFSCVAIGKVAGDELIRCVRSSIRLVEGLSDEERQRCVYVCERSVQGGVCIDMCGCDTDMVLGESIATIKRLTNSIS